MWIFGYGSLIWRPDFAFVERRRGYVDGWSRRFYQGSSDHRGVPGAPGRVVTLLRDPGARCWGVAYRVEGAEAERILDQLDVREQGGYERHHVTVTAWPTPQHPPTPIPGVLLYLASPSNPEFLGPAPLDAMAAQIARSRGPSGANSEYLLRLAAALRSMDVDDPHVFELEERVRELVAAT